MVLPASWLWPGPRRAAGERSPVPIRRLPIRPPWFTDDPLAPRRRASALRPFSTHPRRLWGGPMCCWTGRRSLAWVHWSNEQRLHGNCDHVPPAEFEASFYAAQQTDPAGVGNQWPEPLSHPGRFTSNCLVIAGPGDSHAPLGKGTSPGASAWHRAEGPACRYAALRMVRPAYRVGSGDPLRPCVVQPTLKVAALGGSNERANAMTHPAVPGRLAGGERAAKPTPHQPPT